MLRLHPKIRTGTCRERARARARERERERERDRACALAHTHTHSHRRWWPPTSTQRLCTNSTMSSRMMTACRSFGVHCMCMYVVFDIQCVFYVCVHICVYIIYVHIDIYIHTYTHTHTHTHTHISTHTHICTYSCTYSCVCANRLSCCHCATASA